MEDSDRDATIDGSRQRYAGDECRVGLSGLAFVLWSVSTLATTDEPPGIPGMVS